MCSSLSSRLLRSKAISGDAQNHPPSPTDKALGQLVKGCELAMNSVNLLIAENMRLQKANERVKQKRRLKRQFISREPALTAAEASTLLYNPRVNQDEVDEDIHEDLLLVQYPLIEPTDEWITCYIYRSSKHYAVDCQKYR